MCRERGSAKLLDLERDAGSAARDAVESVLPVSEDGKGGEEVICRIYYCLSFGREVGRSSSCKKKQKLSFIHETLLIDAYIHVFIWQNSSPKLMSLDVHALAPLAPSASINLSPPFSRLPSPPDTMRILNFLTISPQLRQELRVNSIIRKRIRAADLRVAARSASDQAGLETRGILLLLEIILSTFAVGVGAGGSVSGSLGVAASGTC